MASSERPRKDGRAGAKGQPRRRTRAGDPAVRRRTRLARGPLTIGEPAAPVQAQLNDADPYRPDTIADGGSAFAFTVRAASVRGLFKRYTGGPRQDDLCLRLHDPTRTLIVAVADGVSEAPRSGIAAALAVRHAAAAVARQLDRGCQALDYNEVFEQAAWALVEEHRRERGDPGAGVAEASGSLATTLLVAVIAAPSGGEAGAGEPGAGARVQLAAVGDSPAFVLSDHRFRPLVGDRDGSDGLIGGGVQALPRAARAASESTLELSPGSVLLLCTDGLALPLADGGGEVGQTIARELANPPDIVDFARLLDFSRSTYDDDRTLVAVWHEQ